MYSISPVSGLHSLPQPVAVVCHDAGAANVILAEIQACPEIQCLPVMEGPSINLWQAAGKDTSDLVSLEDALSIAASLLTGTSWASDLEHEARQRARQLGLRSAAVIDHWVNYASRFIRNGDIVQPDEFWVTDSYAFEIASKAFPGTSIRKIPNLYLQNQVDEIAAFGPPRSANRVLYVLEPVRFTWPGCKQPGEFEALDYFVENLGKLMNPLTAQLKLRPHPSDATGKYDAWLRAHTHLDTAIDNSRSLSQAISEAGWVAGCESMALVVALAAGRKTVATLPPEAPLCRLPQDGLIHLRLIG